MAKLTDIKNPALNQARKIIWAVDALDMPLSVLKQAARLFASLRKNHPIQVEPVYVLNPFQLGLPEDYSDGWEDRFRPALSKAMEQLVRYFKPGEMKPARILTLDTESTHQSAKLLAKQAIQAEAQLILASTHGRNGLKRLIHGSFAESLVTSSRLPVLVLGPETKVRGPIRHILFLTDFGPGSKDNFKQFVETAASFGARLTLYHSVPHVVEPMLQSGAYLLGGTWIPIPTYLTAEAGRRVHKARAWARWAKQKGVSVVPRVDISGESVVEAVVTMAGAEAVDLIVLESRSGPVAAALMGSITRQVIRRSPCPVLTFHALGEAHRQVGVPGARRGGTGRAA